MIKFYAIASTQYNPSSFTPEDGSLYFLTDTKQLMKGSVQYNRAFEIVENLPTESANIAVGRLYVKCRNVTESGASVTYASLHVFDGSKWFEIFPEIHSSFSAAEENDLVTKGAISSYVTTMMTGFGGDLLKPVQSRSTASSEYTSGDRTLDSIDFNSEKVNKGDMVLVERLGTLYYFSDESPASGDVDGLNTIVPSNLPSGKSGCWKKMLTATVYEMGQGVKTEGSTLTLKVNSEHLGFDTSGNLEIKGVPGRTVVTEFGELNEVLGTLDSGKMPKTSASDGKHVATINTSGNAVASDYTMGGATLSESEKTLTTDAAVVKALTWITLEE